MNLCRDRWLLFKRHVLPTTLAALFWSGAANIAWAGSKDDPLLSKVLVEQLELRDADESTLWVLDGQAWVGKDLQKFWLKAELERDDSETETAELHALYARAVAPYWDMQVGVRHDFQPTPNRSWAVIGLQGLAPYYFHIDTALFIGPSGRTAFRFEAEYEMLFTQRLVLTPELEVNAYGKNDVDIGIGAGLADVEAGLRLRYEIRREFAPYLGVSWEKKFGNSADLASDAGQDTDEWLWVVGLRAWL